MNSSATLGHAVARAGGFAISLHEEREFSGGEHKARPLESVRGKDVYVLSSLHGEAGCSANDKLCRLCFFLATCRENGAARVTAVVPYLAYSRKDRQTKPRDPVTTRYVAALFEAMGTDCVVTLDVHNLSAFQNAFRCRTIHLDTLRLFTEEILSHAGGDSIAIVSPDGGGVKRAELLREAIVEASGQPVEFGFMEKRRSQGMLSGVNFAGDVAGKRVWIVDDMICGGETMLRAAQACTDHGAAEVNLLATHALFTKSTVARLSRAALASVTLTDSAGAIEDSDDALAGKLRQLSVARSLGQTILRLHLGQQVRSPIDPSGIDR